MNRSIAWGVFIASAVMLVWLLLDSTTPAECKVPTEQMSAACLSLVQP